MMKVSVKFRVLPLVAILVAMAVTMVSIAFFAPNAFAQEEEETRYTGAVMLLRDFDNVKSEYINYNTKNITDEVLIEKKVACYESSLRNACGPIAASNIVAYYDNTYTNLIPNFEPMIFNKFYKSADYPEAEAVINAMYSNMRCNQIENGVSEPDYHSGFNTYVRKQGYSFNYTQLVSNGSLDINAFKAQLSSGHPVSIFCKGGALIGMSGSGVNQTMLTIRMFSTNHIVAAYGYQEYTYTLTDGSTRVDRYAMVSTGWPDPDYALVALDGSTYIKSATANIIA